MFSNLIESGSHAADLKRKGRFFLGTVVFYCLLLVATGVGSIYAYNARLDEPNDLEVLALLRYPPAASSEPERRETRPAASQSRVNELTERIEISVETPYHGNQIASTTTREMPAGVPVVVGTIDRDAAINGGPVVGPNLLGWRVRGREAQQREDFKIVRLVEPRVVRVDAADPRGDEEQAVEDDGAEKESALAFEVSRVRPRLDKVAEHLSFLPRAGANGSKRETRKLRPRARRDGSIKSEVRGRRSEVS